MSFCSFQIDGWGSEYKNALLNKVVYSSSFLYVWNEKFDTFKVHTFVLEINQDLMRALKVKLTDWWNIFNNDFEDFDCKRIFFDLIWGFVHWRVRIVGSRYLSYRIVIHVAGQNLDWVFSRPIAVSVVISQNVENLISDILESFKGVLIHVIIFSRLMIIYNELINAASSSIIFFLKINQSEK